jgi:transcription elongation factor GreA
MDTTKNLVVTKSGLDTLKAEYEDLIKVKRPTAVARLANARDQGDLSENSEYSDAKENLAFIDGRIAELEVVLHEVKVVTTHTKGQVDVGCKVTLHIGNKKEVFHIVGEWEANPIEKKISHESPLGKALLGKKVGEQVEVAAPAGKILYKIVTIE